MLVVDSQAQSRCSAGQLLRDCQYQVMRGFNWALPLEISSQVLASRLNLALDAAQVEAVRTSKEALELLAPAASSGDALPFDMVLKEHEPQNGANACRLLRKLARTDLLTRIPVVCE